MEKKTGLKDVCKKTLDENQQQKNHSICNKRWKGLRFIRIVGLRYTHMEVTKTCKMQKWTNKKHIWFYGLFNEQTLNYDRYLWSHWINFLRRNSEWHSNFTISKVEGFIYAEISVPSRNHSSISTNKQLKCRFSLTCFFSSVTKPSGKTLFIIHWKQSE